MSRLLGAEAERRAARFLAQKGLRIIERNWTCRGGEIDLICDADGTLVFVEVRARADSRFGSPEETIGHVKRRLLIRAAERYLVAKGLEDSGCRFDVVAIRGDTVEHFEDAFRAE